MRRLVLAAILSIATGLGALTPALGQGGGGGGGNVPTVTNVGCAITPLGFYAIGTIGCAAVAPMIGTIVLGREMTANEVGRSTLNCFLGPIGWVIGPHIFPLDVVAPNEPPRSPSPGPRQARGRNISVPPPGETHFVPNEVLVEFDAGTSAQYVDALARSLQLTQLETQTFALTGRTLQRWRLTARGRFPIRCARFRAFALFACFGGASEPYLSRATGRTGGHPRGRGGCRYCAICRLQIAFTGGAPHQQWRRCLGRGARFANRHQASRSCRRLRGRI